MNKILNILFVDDDKNVVESFSTAFKLLGHKVEGILDPIVALEKFKENPTNYDVVISDFTMSKMLGLDFISKVKEVNSEVYFVLCTGNEDDLIKDRAQQVGVKKILYKPFDFDVLQDFFNQIMAEKNWR